jgi:glycosyltransferase involved in cell wall biosynthesis
VEVVPSCVDPTAQPLHEHRDEEALTIGWIGSATTTPYLRPILPAVARLAERRRGTRLVLVGADPSVQAPWIEHRPWSLETQAADLAGFDIGVMPLPDTDWARGKCGYKLLQYFAAGVPAVASPVGVNTGLVGDEHGSLATTTEQWLKALTGLAEDADRRREQGASARRFVEQRFAYQAWSSTLADLLRSLLA